MEHNKQATANQALDAQGRLADRAVVWPLRAGARICEVGYTLTEAGTTPYSKARRLGGLKLL